MAAAPGAQVQLVTKSGTSQFHGSGYLYHRNEGLNANTFLNNIRPQFGLTVTPKPLFRYNDPGYTIGGPIPIRKWNIRNKLFFFWSEEWQEQLVPNTAHNVTVPTALERKGDFSQSVSSANHQLVKVYDPTNGQLFPGNVIPASRIWAPGAGIAEPLSAAQPGARRQCQPSFGRHIQLPDAVAGFVSPPRGFAAAGLQRDRKDPRLWPLHQRHI